MIRSSLLYLLIPMSLAAAPAPQATAVGKDQDHVRFVSDDGGVIEFDFAAHGRIGPGTASAVLKNCSDSYQICFSDDRGMAFSFFRRCNSADAEDYGRLTYRPRTVMLLHDDLWIVFDESPNFMFHYRLSEGLVGIYPGRTPSYDFRAIIRKRKVFEDFVKGEYRLAGRQGGLRCVA